MKFSRRAKNSEGENELMFSWLSVSVNLMKEKGKKGKTLDVKNSTEFQYSQCNETQTEILATAFTGKRNSPVIYVNKNIRYR